MLYELWEISSSNLIGAYDTEEAALEVVREAAANHGRRYLATWALASVAPDGETTTLARGTALASRALRLMPT